MKKLHLLKTILLLCALIVGSNCVWATAYISFIGEKQDASTTISNSNVSSGSAGRISWSGTNCTYSDNRVNITSSGSITFTATSGFNITKIIITSGSSASYYGTWTSSPFVTPTSSSGVTTFDGLSANSVTVTTSTNFRCTNASTIKVYYTVAGSDPTIIASNVTITADETSGEIDYSLFNETSATLTAAVKNGNWISNIGYDYENDKVTFTATKNFGVERTATVTLSYTDAEDVDVTITQEKCTFTTLPFIWNGGTSSEISALPGVTAFGTGEYAAGNAPYRVKFDTTGDYILIKTNGQPGVVSIGVKLFGTTKGSTITVQGSTDGTSFDEGEELEVTVDQNQIQTLKSTKSFGLDVRYVRLYYTHKSNIGVGPISIALPEPAGVTDNGDNTVTVPVSVNMNGWRSFIGEADQNYTIESGAKVYYVSETNAGTKKVTLTEIAEGIPANTPVILHKDGATFITLTKTATVIAAPSGNKLAVSTAAQDLSAGVYRLGYKTSDGVGFYKYSSASAPAGIIYISALDAGANFLSFDFGDVTGIENLTPALSQGEGAWFDLQGRRVAQPAKGLYIMNGRKVVIK